MGHCQVYTPAVAVAVLESNHESLAGFRLATVRDLSIVPASGDMVMSTTIQINLALWAMMACLVLEWMK